MRRKKIKIHNDLEYSPNLLVIKKPKFLSHIIYHIKIRLRRR